MSHFAGTFTVTATSGSLTAEAVVVVTPTGTGYLEWIARFPVDDLSPLGDPDGDCLSNLAEFAMGSDPSRNSSMARPRLTPDSLYRYRRLSERNPGDATGTSGDGYSLDGINYTLETSTDLDLWKRASEVLTMTAEGLPVDQGDGYELVTLRLDPPTASETQRVYRLKVTQE